MDARTTFVIARPRACTPPFAFVNEHILQFCSSICRVCKAPSLFKPRSPVNNKFPRRTRQFCDRDFGRGAFFGDLDSANPLILGDPHAFPSATTIPTSSILSCTHEVVLNSDCVSLMVYRICTGSPAFRRGFLRFLTSQFELTATRPLVLRLLIDGDCKYEFDFDWEHRVWTLAMRNEVIREHLAWLSTLGGAFSALGKVGFRAFAQRAGKISVSQWRLALQLGDPILMSRSRIFFAISLIQRREFNGAKKILDREMIICRGEGFASEVDKLDSIIQSVLDYLKHEQRTQLSAEDEQRLQAQEGKLLYREETVRAKISLADKILSMSAVRLDGQRI